MKNLLKNITLKNSNKLSFISKKTIQPLFNNLIKTSYKSHQTGISSINVDPNTANSNNPQILKKYDFDQGLNEEQKKQMKKITIFRYNPALGEKALVSYYINLSNCGPMILDALIHIKDDIDSTLTFRRSCREGICGSCSMNIDGRNTLACLSYTDKDLKISASVMPLPYFQVLKDLVVDMTNFYMQYKSIKPVLLRKTEKEEGQKEYLQSVEDRKELDGLYECILCACCSSHCPSYWWQSNEYLGPAVLMQSYRWIIDSRDEYTYERLEALSGQKLERCYQIGACSLTCPKGLDPRANIKKLQDLYADYKEKMEDTLRH